MADTWKSFPKIECVEAVKNIDAIIAASDAIMVARGDLGIEVPQERIRVFSVSYQEMYSGKETGL